MVTPGRIVARFSPIGFARNKYQYKSIRIVHIWENAAWRETCIAQKRCRRLYLHERHAPTPSRGINAANRTLIDMLLSHGLCIAYMLT